MKEASLVKKIQTYLDGLPKCWHFKTHGSVFSQVGIPDLIFCCQGIFGAIEVKVERNGLSMMQRVILERIRAAGGRCGVARSLDDAIAIIEGRGQPETDSPMEFLFLQEAAHRLPGLVSQYPIPPFIADFCLPQHMLVIEVDGRDYHDPIRDAKKDAYLKQCGYKVIRLTGSQVYEDAVKCVKKVEALINE